MFARARGESDFMILRRHGIRNIALPVITLQFASFSELFGGSVLAETVFSYPGLGGTVSQAGLSGDIPLLLGIVLFSVVFVFWGNFIANILYNVFDPRIREGGSMSDKTLTASSGAVIPITKRFLNHRSFSRCIRFREKCFSTQYSRNPSSKCLD